MADRRGAGRALVFAVAAACAPLCMCASARPEPAAPPPVAPVAGPPPAQPPAQAPAQAPAEAPAEASAEAPASPQSAAAPRAAAAASSDTARDDRIEAMREWTRAAYDFRAAADNCALACRALASMERATVHLCALAVEPADQRRCDEARERLLDSRDHVRRTCGSCPGGPSVERSAPIPSR